MIPGIPNHYVHYSAAMLCGEVASSLPLTRLDLGLHATRGQALRWSCAGETILNVAETMGLPHIDPTVIYQRAKPYDTFPDHIQRGVDVWAAADAYCALAGGGLQWTRLPLAADTVARWMHVRRAGVALTMRWYASDNKPGWGKILEGGAGKENQLHAVCLYGILPDYTWRRFPLFGRLRRAPVFLVENSDAPFPSQHLPMSRIARDGIEAIALVPPGKEGV